MFLFQWFNLGPNLHMPWQLSCHGMCKIVARYDQYFSCKSSTHFLKFELRVHRLFVKWTPDIIDREEIQNTLVFKHPSQCDHTPLCFITITGFDFSCQQQHFLLMTGAVIWANVWCLNQYYPYELDTLKFETKMPTFCTNHCTKVYLNDNYWILIHISLKFNPTCNKSALGKVMWLGTKQKTNHHLNQWWPSSLTLIFITRGMIQDKYVILPV